METVAIVLVILKVMVVIGIVIVYMYKEAQQLAIEKVDFTLPDWPEAFEGVKFLLVADMHRRHIPSHIRQQLQKESFDLIFLGGDIIDKKVSIEARRDDIRFLKTLGPCYFVWGNNDYHVDFRAFDMMLREEGVTVLDNRAVAFEAGDERLWLIGVDEVAFDRDQLHIALREMAHSGYEEGYRILLAHNPLIVDKLKPEHRIRAVFSGHTHGGQICLPLIGAVIANTGRLFPKMVSGLYSIVDGTAKIFITKGVGTSKLPLRLLAKPEINIITMKRDHK